MHPKGEVAAAYGMYLDQAGITDRATVLIDADGIVQYAESVGPGGERDIEALLKVCVELDKKHALAPVVAPQGLPADAVLYVKSNCGFSKAVLTAMNNLHLTGNLLVKNVTEDAAAKAELDKRGGKTQAPALVVGDDCHYESEDIIRVLTQSTTAL